MLPLAMRIPAAISKASPGTSGRGTPDSSTKRTAQINRIANVPCNPWINVIRYCDSQTERCLVGRHPESCVCVGAILRIHPPGQRWTPCLHRPTISADPAQVLLVSELLLTN